jgi:hypothetical protein
LGAWLGRINLTLALFNLIPGFPLDSGRVFRSIVWGLTVNLNRATRLAGAIGQGVAWLFILIGIWQVFTGNWANGLWIAFIGWFLNGAALGGVQRVTLRDVLKGQTTAGHDDGLPACVANRTCSSWSTAILPSGQLFRVMEDGRILGWSLCIASKRSPRGVA